MQYLAEHTTIPVPKVRKAWTTPKGFTFILMDIVPGVELESVWWKMSPATRDKVVDQLKEYVTQLRSLPHPNPEFPICSINGGPLRDVSRIGVDLFGPFRSLQDFYKLVRNKIELEAVLENIRGMEPVAELHLKDRKVVFTHGDLAPRNIMVKMDGTVTAILDWGDSGWYPENWEYTKALLNPQTGPNWDERIAEIVGDYRAEHEVEMLIIQTFGTMCNSSSFTK